MIAVRQTSSFKTWLSQLRDPNARARILTRLRRLELGNPGDAKSVGEGVNELRVPYGSGYRIYFVWRGPEIVLLLCGGDKSSQSRDIAMAKRMAKEL